VPLVLAEEQPPAVLFTLKWFIVTLSAGSFPLHSPGLWPCTETLLVIENEALVLFCSSDWINCR